MKGLITFVTILILSIPVTSQAKEEWDGWDKALFGSYVAFNIVDCGQTIHIYESNGKFYEKNDVIDYMHKKVGKISIPIYFAGMSFISYKIADHLKPIHVDLFGGSFKIPTRKIFLLGINALQYDTVHKNFKLGISMRW